MKPCLSRLSSHTAVFLALIALHIGDIDLVLASPGERRPVLDVNHPLVRNAIDVKDWHAKQIMAIPGVVGMGISQGDDGQPAIRIFTQRAGIPNLPRDLAGIPVQIDVTGMVVARASHESDPTNRFSRPVPIGISTGHPDVTAGTIGARVKDSTGNIYALSNNHIYANGNDAAINDYVIQPGSYDGGSSPPDRIGTLYDYVPIDFSGEDNIVDAAIALTDTELLGISTTPDGYGIPNSATRATYINQPVQKCGRTTGCTSGNVAEISVTLNVCYEGSLFFCSKYARFVDQIAIASGTFSSGGDSGSLIVTDDTSRHPVALLFAGSSTRTFANPIDAVLSSFNVSIDGSTGAGSPTTPGDEDPTNIVLSAMGYKVKGRHNVDLEWTGAGGSSVKVWRDEALIGTVDNNGIYTDSTDNRGGGSYSYQICEADSSNCSDVVTVAF